MIGLIGKDLKVGFLKDLVLSMHQGINTVADKIEYLDKGVPILQSKHITKGFVDISNMKYVHPSVYDKYAEKYNPSPNNILVCNIGTIGKNVRVIEGRNFLIAWNLFLIKLNEDLLDSKYFSHYLDYLLIKKYYDRFLTGGTVKFINKKTMGNIPIPLPPLKTQQRIAGILDDAAALRDKTAQLLTEYDLLSQSIFLEMFGDPAINQKQWDMVKFGDVGKLDRGKSKHRPRNAPELLGGNYPLVQTGDIANCDKYITEYKSTYSEKGLAQSKLWPKGTLCITIAANIANTGILAIDACFPDSVVGFIPNEKTNNLFTQFWMLFLQKIIEANAPQAAQKNINLKILKELDFFCPPIELQNEFADKIGLIEQQKALAKQELQESEDLFNCLLQQAFKGELV